MNVVVNENDGAAKRWSDKRVLNETMLAPVTAELSGQGQMFKTEDGLKTVTVIDEAKRWAVSTVKLKFSDADWSAYNRLSVWVYPEAVGFQNFYFHCTIYNQDDKPQTHAPALIPNQWNHIIWEIDDIARGKVKTFSIGPVFFGVPPEACPEVKFYYKNFAVQKVNPDYTEGWDLDKRIAYSHSGYITESKKIALTQTAKNNRFEIISADNKRTSYPVKKVTTELGSYIVLDFSELTEPGRYRLALDNRITPEFIISAFPFRPALIKSVAFLKTLRCGDDVMGVHSPCHLNCHTFHPDGRMVPNHGGWHDAGDVSQFEICTAEIAYALLKNGEINMDKALAAEIRNEGRWGSNWLLRTHFGDGYRALAVHYSMWQKNILKNTAAISPRDIAENGPFENFCAAAALAAAASAYKNRDKIFADWCRRTAEADFWFAVDGLKKGLFTKRWGPLAAAQVDGHGAIAAAELYTLTGDKRYLRQGAVYAETVCACQEDKLPAWQRPLRGFFYKNPDHKEILNYEHRGHEQSPVCGLVRMYEVAADYPDAPKWLASIKLYREYILNTIKLTSPFNLLPAYIYDVTKINLNDHIYSKTVWTEEKAREELIKQAQAGIKLDADIYIRKFPIALGRRGFHATLLSKTKAVSAIARLLRDNGLIQIALDQLEWILGKNPFAASTMYGEGYNYHPLYVAFSGQMVGALPVGIQTKGKNDRPYWPTGCQSVYKEIWGHTAGKFIEVLTDIIAFYQKQ